METPASDHSESKRKRLLYIDDDALARKSLSALLDTWGYDVDSVDNPETALSRFANGSYDLVITDMKMPGMDGLELTRQIKIMVPDIPVVVISGIMALDSQSENEGPQPDCVLVKPLAFKEFAAQLRSMLGQDGPAVG